MKNDKTNTKPRKAFFFLRHNNDIDHIAPVIYKWLSTKKIPTEIIICTDRSFLDDNRIKLLKQFDNAKISYINDFFKKKNLSYWFNRFYFNYNAQFDKLIKKHPYLRKKADEIIRKIAEEIFKDTKKGIVVFDWTLTHFVQQMVQIAKKRKFTAISLPHGDAPYFTKFYSKNEFDYSCLDQYALSKIFDYVVIPNKVCLKRYENYMEKDHIKILGSPRYNDEWMEIVSKLMPHFSIKGSENKLKIVFFLRNIGYPIFWEEVVRTIKLVLQFPDVYLVVKHHPRNTDAKKLTKKLLNLFPEIKRNLDVNLKFIYHGMDSSSLIKWADIIFDLGTSITWDAVKQGKPVLMLEYQYANYSTLAHYMNATEIKCKDQLYDTMQKFITKKNYRFYDEKDRKRFIKEIIDVPDENVLGRYVDFLEKCLNESVKK